MDYYVENLTYSHHGRIPVCKCELAHPWGNPGWETTLKFIKQCNHGDFRNYYFRPGVVDIIWIQILKYIIIHANPDVFKHAVTEFRDEFAGFLISLNYYVQNTLYDYHISYYCDSDSNNSVHYNDISKGGEITEAALIERGFKKRNIFIPENTHEFYYKIK